MAIAYAGEFKIDAVKLSYQTDKTLDELATNLGVVIANLVGAFNIQHVVLTGRVDQLNNTLLEAARNSATRHALPAMVENTRLEFSMQGTDIVILGGSALVLQAELGII